MIEKLRMPAKCVFTFPCFPVLALRLRRDYHPSESENSPEIGSDKNIPWALSKHCIRTNELLTLGLRLPYGRCSRVARVRGCGDEEIQRSFRIRSSRFSVVLFPLGHAA